MRVLITGGTGFIGSRLALDCLERGETVRVFTQANNEAERWNARLLEEQGAEIALGSVADADAAHEATRSIDVVYHLAAAQHEANVPDQRFQDVNVTGTRNLLEASVAAGIRRFVHGSTIGVYGGRSGVTVHDDSPLTPTNIYGRTKLEAEHLVRAFHDRLPTVTVRISETYGPGDRRLLKLFRGIRRSRFFFIGAGGNLHHPIYVDDLILGLRLAAERDEAVGRTMVLAGPEPTSTRAMVGAVATALSCSAPKLTLPLWPFMAAAVVMENTIARCGIQPPLHRRRLNFFTLSFAFDNESARHRLGFRPAVDFVTGAARTAAWYRENGLLDT